MLTIEELASALRVSTRRVADLQAQVKQLQDTLALQKRSYEREIELEVAAERERCAKIAERGDEGDWSRNTGDFDANRGRDIAAAIRAADTAV